MDAVSLRVLTGAAGGGQQLWGQVINNRPKRAMVLDLAFGDATGVAQRSASGWRSLSALTTPDNLRDFTGAAVGMADGPLGYRAYTLVSGSSGVYEIQASNTVVNVNQVLVAGGSTYTDITYTTAGVFYAVGSGGLIHETSTGNIQTWTSVASGVTSQLTAVTYHGGYVLIVGFSGVVLRRFGSGSVEQYAAGSSTLNSIAHDAGDGPSGPTFVAVGDSIYRSTDYGVTWTEQTNPNPNPGLRSVVWAGDKFVAMSDRGQVIYSADGVTWTVGGVVAAGAVEGSFLKLVYSSSVLVAFGNAGEIFENTTSLSGWVQKNVIPGLSIFFTAIAWDGIKFTLLESAGSGVENVYTTTDGLSYTKTPGATTNNFEDLLWTGSQFVACGNFGVTVSADGVTWTERPSSGSQLQAVAWSGTTYVVVGQVGNILTSTDTVTWTARSSGIAAPLRGVAWGAGVFVTVSSFGDIRSSPTGTTWTSRFTSGIVSFRDVIFANGLFVAVGSSLVGGPAAVYTSPNGTTWTQRTAGIPSGTSFAAVVWDGRQYVVFGVGVMTSPDGITWTTQLALKAANAPLDAAASSGVRTIACGSYSAITMSPRPPTPPYPTV